jgi:hypothetical protein
VDQQFIELFDIKKLSVDSKLLPCWPEILDPQLAVYSGEMLDDYQDNDQVVESE